MRIGILLIIELLCTPAMYAISGGGFTNTPSISDTVIQLPEVVTAASRNQHFGSDVKTDVYNRKALSMYAGESLGQFMATNTAINIKAYGAGGALSNITLRGTSSSHVQVNWNGFPINSVTLGSSDFSMIPAGGFDRVSIAYGASGALYGSGTFGGAINLDNNLTPQKGFTGTVQAGYESLKTINSSVTLSIGNDRIAWQINAWGAKSDNEFSYYDYINQYQRKQTDGAWNDAGFIQSAVLKLTSNTSIEAGAWYQVKEYNIPSHVGSTSYELQKDSTLKLFVAFKTHGQKWGLQAKMAMFDDTQQYWQKASAQTTINSIASHISARQWHGDINLRYHLHTHLSIDAGFTGSTIRADVSAYGKEKEENGLSSFVGLKYDNHRLSWQTALRKEWSNDFNSRLLASVGGSWQLNPDNWTLRANASQKFRKPTFNDRYWQPGGNISLKPEQGYASEMGIEGNIWENGKSKLSTDLSLYYSHIDDMIEWRPGGANWIAKNYQQVKSMGSEIKITFSTLHRQWKYNGTMMLTLNKSKVKTTDAAQEEIMTYSPRVITMWHNHFEYSFLDFTMIHHFTSDRFYDNNALLKPYHTIDIQLGAKIGLAKGKIGVNAMFHNLTNTTYEMIRLYPMPGRYWSVKMNYTF